jgi:hypothetical protein
MPVATSEVQARPGAPESPPLLGALSTLRKAVTPRSREPGVLHRERVRTQSPGFGADAHRDATLDRERARLRPGRDPALTSIPESAVMLAPAKKALEAKLVVP